MSVLFAIASVKNSFFSLWKKNALFDSRLPSLVGEGYLKVPMAG
jgi:hypothetical protein